MTKHTYSREAVAKEIAKDKRIKPAEAKRIHAVLQGWRGKDVLASGKRYGVKTDD